MKKILFDVFFGAFCATDKLCVKCRDWLDTLSYFGSIMSIIGCFLLFLCSFSFIYFSCHRIFRHFVPLPDSQRIAGGLLGAYQAPSITVGTIACLFAGFVILYFALIVAVALYLNATDMGEYNL